MKLKNSYKLVSFNVTLVATCKRCHTCATKLINLCYLKIHELKALDCLRKTTSAFFIERYTINLKKLFL
ncbi:hypothetical protein [Bacillus cereus]|uniref:Uncharacterized protein n=1 Tax=Bacillus cereus TaxID=1396 RepID=A0A2A8ZSB4_BACCE|nr:hypothetical protein [Bacillus cereus]PFE08537.1 hypothetical protein CN307_28535 [Bacillus cereus]